MSEREAARTFRRRGLVWNRYADGLRAFGFDFGPFALVVLLDGDAERNAKIEAVLSDPKRRAVVAWSEDVWRRLLEYGYNSGREADRAAASGERLEAREGRSRAVAGSSPQPLEGSCDCPPPQVEGCRRHFACKRFNTRLGNAG